MYRVYILLGSNLGDREQYLSDAVMELMDRLMPDYLEVASLAEAVNTSDVIETEPVGFSCPDKFLNQSFCCLTEYEPQQVLKICQEIETELGRVRTGAQYNEKGERIYQSRCIDIDILSMEKQNGEKWEAVVVDTPDLTIPHPQLKTRPFARDLYRVLKK